MLLEEVNVSLQSLVCVFLLFFAGPKGKWTLEGHLYLRRVFLLLQPATRGQSWCVNLFNEKLRHSLEMNNWLDPVCGSFFFCRPEYKSPATCRWGWFLHYFSCFGFSKIWFESGNEESYPLWFENKARLLAPVCSHLVWRSLIKHFKAIFPPSSDLNPDLLSHSPHSAHSLNVPELHDVGAPRSFSAVSECVHVLHQKNETDSFKLMEGTSACFHALKMKPYSS